MQKTGEGYVLAIESSCDETAAAVADLKGNLFSSVVASSADLFVEYGGVVPEIASRKHMELLPHVVQKALGDAGIEKEDLSCIAGTMGPGLVGALLCGLSYAKAMAFALDVPFIGINHMEGHIAANQVENDMIYPHVCLTVSGGHTQLLLVKDATTFYQLGQTVDDAAGEAFDKAARALNLPYPGGPNVERLAREGNEDAFTFTRPKLKNKMDFSFSGIKTAVINLIHTAEQRGEELNRADVAASFQKAVVEMLLKNAFTACKEQGVTALAVCGGVAANGYLRQKAEAWANEAGITLYLPGRAMCTDNAAMIVRAAVNRIQKGEFMGLETNAIPSLKLQFMQAPLQESSKNTSENNTK
ncbi:MAG: tRNA (adenosine(37)-N6)-threonylcarbamoyltransferase complex transferase subunit TsaD [Clostridiales bacterium]|nr:tRNA (adenosine(37)-N6)-threonylcarbamoyltransferase complex transferase subunit TsaD [Clostridiales bacterium]